MEGKEAIRMQSRFWRRATAVGAAVCLAGALFFAPGDAHAQRAGYSMDFDGDDYVETGVNAGDLGIAGNAAKSIEAWAYTRSFNDGGIFALGVTGTASEDFSLRTLGSANQWRVQFWGGDFDIDFEYPSQNTWVHFALVHTGSETIVYVDGAQIAREPRELNTSTQEPFRIGFWRADPWNVYDGRIAEVRVWNREISAAEIQANMHRSLTGDEDGLIGYWPLNEGSGTTAVDLAQGNDGSFVGDPEWIFEWPFVQDLTGQIITAGQTATLGPVELYGAEDETYTWFKDGEVIAGAEDASYTVTNAQAEDSGVYHVEVDDARDETPLESAHVRLDVWENLPGAGIVGLALLGAALAGGAAWTLRRRG